MLLTLIIDSLTHMYRCRVWPLYTVVLLLIFNKIELVKYVTASASSISTNNNNFRNDSRLLISPFEKNAPDNRMPYMYVYK